MKNVKWQLANYQGIKTLFGPVWEWPEPLYKVARGLSWRNEVAYRNGMARDGVLHNPNWLEAPGEDEIAKVVADYIIKNRAKLIASARRRKATAMKRVQALQEEEDMFTPVYVTSPTPEEVVKEAA